MAITASSGVNATPFIFTLNKTAASMLCTKLSVKNEPERSKLNLSLLTIKDQEKTLIRDILQIFAGNKSELVELSKSKHYGRNLGSNGSKELRIRAQVDSSLQSQIKNIVPLASHLYNVREFLYVYTEANYGLTNHALCGAVRTILKEFDKLLIKLEAETKSDETASLSYLELTLSPAFAIIEQISAIVSEIMHKVTETSDVTDDFDEMKEIIESLGSGTSFEKAVGQSYSYMCARGSSILNIIYKRATLLAGDPLSRKILLSLGKEAEKPYLKMLEDWIYRGEIKDPYNEFMIKERKNIMREKISEDYTDEYWEKRYTLREVELPYQLESVKDKILIAGKYLNVIRECGAVSIPKREEGLPSSIMDPSFIEAIDKAYKFANQYLLEFLISTHDLYRRMKSLKQYFFLDSSDFFTQFLDQATYELKKPASKVQIDRLQNLLELALRQPGTVVHDDPFKDDLKAELNHLSLMDWLLRIVTVTGLEEVPSVFSQKLETRRNQSDSRHFIGFYALQFDFKVPFPSSLVLSKKAILRYQLIFRHLLNLIYVQRSLEEAWMEHSQIRRSSRQRRATRESQLFLRAIGLRARMFNFIQQLFFYVTSEIIEPSWQLLLRRLKTVQTVDDLMREHIDCLDTCLKECLLTNSKLLKVQAKLFNTCISFSMSQTHMIKTLRNMTEDQVGSNTCSDTISLERWESYETKCEESFDRNLKHFLDGCYYYANTESQALMSLIVRLEDGRNFVTDRRLV